MKRRSLIVGAAAVVLGCGSRPPPRPLPTLKNVGLLPVHQWPPSSSIAPYSSQYLELPALGAAPVPFGATGIGLAIGHAMRSGKAAEKRALTGALENLKFDPMEVFSQALTAITATDQRLVAITDSRLISDLRDDEFKAVPANWDAIIDVQIDSAGYYPKRGGGFTPILSVRARLLDPRPPVLVPVHFDYSVETGDAGGDPRFFTTPPALTTESMGEFASRADALRAGLKALHEKVAEKLVQDIRTVLRGEPAAK